MLIFVSFLRVSHTSHSTCHIRFSILTLMAPPPQSQKFSFHFISSYFVISQLFNYIWEFSWHHRWFFCLFFLFKKIRHMKFSILKSSMRLEAKAALAFLCCFLKTFLRWFLIRKISIIHASGNFLLHAFINLCESFKLFTSNFVLAFILRLNYCQQLRPIK